MASHLPCDTCQFARMCDELEGVLDELQQDHDFAHECALREEAHLATERIEQFAIAMLSSEPSTDVEVACQLCIAKKLIELRAPLDLPHVQLIRKAMSQALSRLGSPAP